MPQTKAGANNSTWIAYLRQCAKDYHAEQETKRNGKSDAHNPSAKKQMAKQTGESTVEKGVPKRRVTGKQTVESTVDKGVPKRRVTGKQPPK